MATDNASSEPLKEDDEIAQLKVSLQREKAAKRKMYSYLVKIADELKSLVSLSVFSMCRRFTQIPDFNWLPSIPSNTQYQQCIKEE